jgi:hypothetical protein
VSAQQSTKWRGQSCHTAIDAMATLAEDGLLTRAHEAGYAEGLMRGFRIGVFAASGLIGATAALVLVGRWWP